jgi:alpha-ketoglutarate-dependent taurine dioxygenase
VVREACSPSQLAALAELDLLLSNPSLQLTTLLPPGSLLLLDNTRWFHGRSAIMDEQRWLKRVRFNAGAERQREQQQQQAGMPLLQRLVSRTDSL